MISIQQIDNYPHRFFHGQYRVLGIDQKYSEALGKTIRKLHLADATGERWFEIFSPKRMPTEEFSLGGVVDARSDLPSAGLTARLKSAKIVPRDSIENAARLIPREQCPKRAIPCLAKLADLIDSIQSPSAKKFINSLVDRYYQDMLPAKAGWKYHHTYPGGLLVHTVRVMIKSEEAASDVYITERSRVELIMLAAFLHDAGKCVTTNPENQRYRIGSTPRHEALSEKMAQFELNQLKAEWPEGARRLRSMLHWLASPGYIRRQNIGNDAEFVQHADILDVKRDRRARALNRSLPESPRTEFSIHDIL